MRIALYGEAGAGKSHIANLLRDKHNFRELSFADPIYDLAKKYFNMKEKDRRILVGLGESGRDLYYNIWVDKLHHKLQSIPKEQNIVVSDLRRFNEYYYLISEKFIPIKIVSEKKFQSEGVNNTDELLSGGHTHGELDDVPMITLINSEDEFKLRESLKIVINQYDNLFEARLKGGKIYYE